MSLFATLDLLAVAAVATAAGAVLIALVLAGVVLILAGLRRDLDAVLKRDPLAQPYGDIPAEPRR